MLLSPPPPRALPPFPTRRSSDLIAVTEAGAWQPGKDPVALAERDGLTGTESFIRDGEQHRRRRAVAPPRRDRKSTRLNSSHVAISYAVFCLKKKKKMN